MDTSPRHFLSLVGKTLANDIWHQLREKILSGALAPGQRLHFENLKAEYEVSFGTLREALSRLAGENLVIANAQRGFIVAPISVEEMLDITRVRVLLEGEALRSSIKNGDKAWRASVLKAFHNLDSLTVDDKPNTVAWADAHRAFHASLIAACNSPIMIDFCVRLFDSASRFRRLSMGQRVYHRHKSSEHRAIMEAALIGDEEAAQELMSKHMWETTNNVVEALQGMSLAADGKAQLDIDSPEEGSPELLPGAKIRRKSGLKRTRKEGVRSGRRLRSSVT